MKVMTFISLIKRDVTIDKTSEEGGRGRETRFRIFLSFSLSFTRERERERRINIRILHALILTNINFLTIR